jgi:hypothetical protein
MADEGVQDKEKQLEIGFIVHSQAMKGIAESDTSVCARPLEVNLN